MTDLPRAPVWPWYVAYCVLMALVYAVVLMAGIAFLVWTITDPQLEVAMGAFVGGAMIVVGGLLLVGYAILPNLPRRPWAWTVHLVVLVIGVIGANPLCALPLFVFWIRDETKASFGR